MDAEVRGEKDSRDERQLALDCESIEMQPVWCGYFYGVNSVHTVLVFNPGLNSILCFV